MSPVKEEGHRLATVTPDNNGPVFEILIWIFFVMVLLATISRLWIRFSTSHVPGLDDVVATISCLFFAGMTAAAVQSVRDGAGKRDKLLSGSDANSVMKDSYVNLILYYFVLTLAKATIVIFIHRLAVARQHITTNYVVAGFVIVWGVAAVFAAAFQNPPPRTWIHQDGKGINFLDFTYAMSAFDIVTDLALCILPVWIVWGLQMEAASKRLVFFAFIPRTIVIAVCIVRFVLLKRLGPGPDYFHRALGYLICTQLQACLGIVVSCMPALRPLVDKAATGLLDASMAPRPDGTTFGGNTEGMAASIPASGLNRSSRNGSRVANGSASRGLPSPKPRSSQRSLNKVGRANSKSSKRSQAELDSANGVTEKLAEMPANPSLALRPDMVQHQSSATGGLRTGSIESAGSPPENEIRETKKWEVRHQVPEQSVDSQATSEKTDETLRDNSSSGGWHAM